MGMSKRTFDFSLSQDRPLVARWKTLCTWSAVPGLDHGRGVFSAQTQIFSRLFALTLSAGHVVSLLKHSPCLILVGDVRFALVNP